ncbi:MAG: CBASS oligonucleotide cyclase [Candidatus Pacebacteria bacterium]|nr:CBASS oligonucleotide cyclase [Candidatus Paceibacterota bacterium]
MELNNSQLKNYRDRIKFSREDKLKYQNQIDNLISSINSKIAEQTDTKVTKVLQCGSWKKGTIIKPTEEIPIDIDLVFFLDIDTNEYDSLYQVHDLILPILKSIYPQKSDDDFWDNPKTAGVEFIDSGLNVDIVPVGKTSDPDYVAQPDKDFAIYFTSPQKQLDFISERKEANTNYKTIVRLLKKWRNFQNVELSSFAIELIVAHLDINKGIESDIREAILRFFKLIGKKKFPVILFNAPYGSYEDDGSHVYIADPTNEENNIVKSVSNTEWTIVKKRADTAFETLLLADGEENMMPTIDLWKEVFGNDFNINEN